MPRKKKDLFELRQKFREQFAKNCKNYLHALVQSTKKHDNLPLTNRCDQRQRFLRACFAIEPEMVKTLQNDVKPLCPSVLSQHSPEYDCALDDWLNRFNLNYDWVRWSIDTTLRNWDRFDCKGDDAPTESKQEDNYVPLIIASGDASQCININPLFEFACPWNIAMNGIGNEFEAFCNMFSEELCCHLELQVKAAHENGITFPCKEQERRYASNEKFEWLAMRVVHKWKKAQIVEKYKVGNPNNPKEAQNQVRKDINELARQVGVKTR